MNNTAAAIHSPLFLPSFFSLSYSFVNMSLVARSLSFSSFFRSQTKKGGHCIGPGIAWERWAARRHQGARFLPFSRAPIQTKTLGADYDQSKKEGQTARTAPTVFLPVRDCAPPFLF